MRNKCHIFLIYPRQNKGGNLFGTLVVQYSYMSHIKQKAKEKKMSVKTDTIEQGNSLFIELPNGDSVNIFTYDDYNDVKVEISRHNGDYTNYPNIDYKEQVQLGNVERRTSTLPKKKKRGAVKINEKTLTLSNGVSMNNRTTVQVATYNTQSN